MDATREQAQYLIDAVNDALQTPTHYRDDTPVPAKGDTPPVPQPDSRRVPAWATGIAVASLGIGAGAVGIGCAVWLAAKGLAAITLTGVLAALSPFVGLAALVLAIGAAIARVGRASTTNVYKGSVSVTNKTEIRSTAKGLFARNRNQIRGTR
jgi:predicted phage tail protein